MYLQVTPFLLGKLHAMGGHRARCPYEPDTKAAEDYAAGYSRGQMVR